MTAPNTPAPLHVKDTLFALVMTAAFLLIAGVAAYHHEMWRDEMGPWLIGRESGSLVDIFRNTRYDGHPLLWYLLVWPLSRLSGNPESIKLVNLAAAGAAVFLLAARAPFPRWVRAAAALGYFPLYEYGTISRNYGIGLLALVAFCVFFPQRRSRPLLVGAALLVAANTSMMACILAIAATAMLLCDAVAGETPANRSTWGGIALACAGILLASWQMIPPADSGYAMGWHYDFDAARAGAVLKTVAGSFLPLPVPGPGFWESQLLSRLPLFRSLAGVLSVVLLVLPALALARRPRALLYFAAGTCGLLSFFYLKHLAYLRHHGFLFICLGTACWIARTLPAVPLPPLLERGARGAGRAAAASLPLLLLVHVAGGAIAVAGDVRYPFSGAKETAELIRSRGLAGLPLVADLDVSGMPVVGYLGKRSVYYPCGDRWGSFVIWDTGRMLHSVVWGEPLREAAKQGTPVVVVVDDFVMKKFPPPQEILPRLRQIGCRSGGIVTEESYCVYTWSSPSAEECK